MSQQKNSSYAIIRVVQSKSCIFWTNGPEKNDLSDNSSYTSSYAEFTLPDLEKLFILLRMAEQTMLTRSRIGAPSECSLWCLLLLTGYIPLASSENQMGERAIVYKTNFYWTKSFFLQGKDMKPDPNLRTDDYICTAMPYELAICASWCSVSLFKVCIWITDFCLK